MRPPRSFVYLGLLIRIADASTEPEFSVAISGPILSPAVPQSTRKPLEQWPAVIVQRTLVEKSRPVKPTEQTSLPTAPRHSLVPARTPVSQLSRASQTSGWVTVPGSSITFTPAGTPPVVSAARCAGGTATTTRLVSTSMPTWPPAAAPSGPAPPRSAAAWRSSSPKLRVTSVVSTCNPSSRPRRRAASPASVVVTATCTVFDGGSYHAPP